MLDADMSTRQTGCRGCGGNEGSVICVCPEMFGGNSPDCGLLVFYICSQLFVNLGMLLHKRYQRLRCFWSKAFMSFCILFLDSFVADSVGPFLLFPVAKLVLKRRFSLYLPQVPYRARRFFLGLLLVILRGNVTLTTLLKNQFPLSRKGKLVRNLPLTMVFAWTNISLQLPAIIISNSFLLRNWI